MAQPATAAPSARAHQPPRIVAVGDLHGDYQAWIEIASRAGLIDRGNRWTGGSAVLVQTGDITDRGPDSLKIIRHLMRLKGQARRSGGRVVVVLGNHEAMNMTEDLRYVHPGEFAAFANADSDRMRRRIYEANKATIIASYRSSNPAMTDAAIRDAWLAANPPGKLEHQAAWSPRGELGRWAMANPAVARIGDTVFVHGGISLRYAAVPVEQINRLAAAALAARTADPTAIINDPFGPLWYRGYVTRTAESEGPAPTPVQGLAAPAYPSPDEELTAVLRSTGAKRMVIAHTPNRAGIAILYGGRLALIDTGISRYYGGKLSYLEILGDRLVPHSWERSR
ncbi:MAG TPA: metallophosphoesterase [Sphingomicrobium sp.]